MANPTPSLAVGRRLGAYEVLGLAGAGAMGEVYRVRDLKLQRDVALKVLPPALVDDPERLARFEREARILASLNHPGIVTIHSVEEIDGVRFLTMEMVEGQPLSDLIPPGGLPLDRVLAVAVPLVSALAAAHARGIVHRDLKPANVMVAGDGTVKILDFGIAKIRDERSGDQAETALATSPRQIVGTVAYMAPEQIEGRSVDHRADIFALGIMLFELVSGKRPFTGETSMAVAAAILKETPPALTDLGPGVSADLARLIKRCLEKDPARRVQTALDVRNELDEMRAAPHAVAAARAAGPEHATRSRGWIWAVGALLTLAFVVGAWQLWPAPTSLGPIESVAVLPFINATGDPALDYLSDGLTETLTNSLTNVPDIRVTPRTLAARYRGVTVDPREAGTSLRVRAVVTGQIARRGDRLSVQAELIDVETVAQLWGDQFDRGVSEALAVQTDLAAAIARGLRPRLTTEEERGLAVGTRDPVAYDLFLKALHGFSQLNSAGMAQATDYLQQAVALDPNYAAAYTQLSRVLGTRANQGHVPPGDAYPRAIAAARRAIEIDEESAPAHAALAASVVHYEWDWSEAERHFQRAVALDPQDAEANFLYASFFLRYRGRFDEALAHMARAEAVNPLDTRITTQMAGVLILTGRYDEAVTRLQRVLAIQPDFTLAHRAMALIDRLRGAADASIAAAERLQALKDPMADALLAQAYHAAGRRQDADALASQVAARAESSAGTAVIVAGVYAVLEEPDRALDWLERAYKARDPMLVGVYVAREFDSIRMDPRFQDLLRRIGLP